MKKTIALCLVELRTKLGMSRTSFAKSVGSSQSSMKRFETGAGVPKEKLINRICEEYHVNPAYFTGEIGIDEAITETAEDDKKNAGKRLKQIRLEMDMSLMEFSKITDTSDAQLSQIELGNRPLTEKRANDIAEKLHVSVDWLLYGDERAKDYPVDAEMVEWLKAHPEKRMIIEQWMKEDE